MSALFDLPLSLDASTDFYALVTCIGQDYVPISIAPGATAKLEIKATALDPSALVTVTTTPSSSGGLLFGVGLPSPAGTSCMTEAAVSEHGFPGSATTVPPVANQGSVATLAALGTLDPTSFIEGDVVFVTASPGAFYAWSPGDPNTPNGTTIIAGAELPPDYLTTGNWLYCGTVAVTLTAQALAAIAGYDYAVYDVTVTWANGTTTKLLGRRITIDQTIS